MLRKSLMVLAVLAVSFLLPDLKSASAQQCTWQFNGCCDYRLGEYVNSCTGQAACLSHRYC